MRVQFLRDTACPYLPELPAGTLVLYRDGFGYGIPDIKGAEYMEFRAYKARYTALTPPFIVVVGLNRIITPSNRCEMVNEYLQTMTKSIPKICLDTKPFIGEPWRLWYHYSISNVGKFNVPHSYAFETEWKKWFYRDQNDCRLSGPNIRLLLADTISDLDCLTTKFELYEMNADDDAWYQAAKDDVFARYATPKLLINSLLSLANRRYGIKISYDSFLGNGVVSAPNLGVYRFVIEESERRMKIYNEVIRYGRESLSRAKHA